MGAKHGKQLGHQKKSSHTVLPTSNKVGSILPQITIDIDEVHKRTSELEKPLATLQHGRKLSDLNCRSHELTKLDEKRSVRSLLNTKSNPSSARTSNRCSTKYDSTTNLSFNNESVKAMDLNSKSPTEIMMERYNNMLEQLPSFDQQDVMLEFEGYSSQFAPEYSQECYKHMKALESSNQYFNYLCNQSASKQLTDKVTLHEADRIYCVTRIMELNEKKGYKPETFFLAVRICDRYLAMKEGIFNKDRLPILVVTCMILAAKMEQPISPSIRRMIILLPVDEQETVTKQAVINLEEQIILSFGFDFTHVSPLFFLERFMRVAELNDSPQIIMLAEEILKLSQLSCDLLNQRPSQIAGASMILAETLLLKKRNEQQDGLGKCWNEVMVEFTGLEAQEFDHALVELTKLIHAKVGQQLLNKVINQRKKKQ